MLKKYSIKIHTEKNNILELEKKMLNYESGFKNRFKNEFEYRSNSRTLSEIKKIVGAIDVVDFAVEKLKEIYPKDVMSIILGYIIDEKNFYHIFNSCEKTRDMIYQYKLYLGFNKPISNFDLDGFWESISCDGGLPINFILLNKKHLLWDVLSNNGLPKEIFNYLDDLDDYIDWHELIPSDMEIPSWVLKMKYQSIDWHHLFNNSIDEYLLQEIIDYSKGYYESAINLYTRENDCYDHQIRWNKIFAYSRVSETFIKKYYKNSNSWKCISKHQTLSIKFMKEFENFIDFNVISKHQTLTPEFVIKYQYEVCWKSIMIHQKFNIYDWVKIKKEVLWVNFDVLNRHCINLVL